VLTMDILWAMSHPPGNPSLVSSSRLSLNSSVFAVPTPPYADGSWDMYEDFVGGVQFWGYALVSGSGDSAVRMWDSECSSRTSLFNTTDTIRSQVRTGQAHRTLMGHTGPVTCLQFDERHIVSGSLDKTVRVCKFLEIRDPPH
jgi:mitochondrial division protein 1